MYKLEPEKLLLAAKTSISLIGVLHETIWQLFPDELLAFTEENEERLLAALSMALQQNPIMDPDKRFHIDPNDIFGP